uniref:[histone H3]-lysine(4) N-trimethyltransferase n=1 Tax=Accipiter nisus TaxID=211598 RepID=A0A8B9MSP3_9AVES
MEPAALERFASPGKGSGLRSRRRVRPGELLYRAEPFAYVVTKEQLGGVCERCLRRNEHLHRCSQCKVAKYCGKSCQKEAWLDHKQECRCLKNMQPNFPPDSVRLAGRIVFKLVSDIHLDLFNRESTEGHCFFFDTSEVIGAFPLTSLGTSFSLCG